MGKVGKTFTLDVKVLMWLEEYAKEQKEKESAVVNGFLRSAMQQSTSWKCLDCQSINDNQFTTCYNCPGVKA
jgi:hypothetical protein